MSHYFASHGAERPDDYDDDAKGFFLYKCPCTYSIEPRRPKGNDKVLFPILFFISGGGGGGISFVIPRASSYIQRFVKSRFHCVGLEVW